MQFRTPQFIDVEDKIFGPFTFKQFIYLAGGAGGCFVLYKLLPIYIAIAPMLALAGLALALTFYRVNNKPFIHILQAYITFATQNKLYIWKKEAKTEKAPVKEKEEPKDAQEAVPRFSQSKLKDLAWSLDVLDKKK